MKWMKHIIMHYFIELNNEGPVDDEDLEFRADNLVADIERTLSARMDFKPGKEEA